MRKFNRKEDVKKTHKENKKKILKTQIQTHPVPPADTLLQAQHIMAPPIMARMPPAQPIYRPAPGSNLSPDT